MSKIIIKGIEINMISYNDSDYIFLNHYG